MLANQGSVLLLAGLLATALPLQASAEAVVTTEQVALGQAAAVHTIQQAPSMVALAPPVVARETYTTPSSGRPLNPLAGERGQAPTRVYAASRRATEYAAARRSCSHLGCRGVHVLGVGF